MQTGTAGKAAKVFCIFLDSVGYRETSALFFHVSAGAFLAELIVIKRFWTPLDDKMQVALHFGCAVGFSLSCTLRAIASGQTLDQKHRSL